MTSAQNLDYAEHLVRALEFEGYLLYPYRADALKNRQRWALGTLYPPGASQVLCEPTSAVCELLVRGSAPALQLSLRLLHIEARVENDEAVPGWHEAVQRQLDFELTLPCSARSLCFELPRNEYMKGRYRYTRERLLGRLELSATSVGAELYCLRLELENDTPCTDHERVKAYTRSLASPHLILHCRTGSFISMLDPPAHLTAQVARCRPRGWFPVLVGRPGDTDTMLCSPTILYDYPRMAAESPGDLFDLTEIDELLSLRIQTLTPREKQLVRETDARARAMLERTEQLTAEQLLLLHGRTESLQTHHKVGDRVRLAPKPGGDIFDLALRGESATVRSIERDLEGNLHFAVTVDLDPGADLGLAGQPGHRFFFSEDELEPLP